jgi:hypothetical protein
MVLLLAGCAGLERGQSPGEKPQAPPPPLTTKRPESPALAGLPPEARNYLDQLARAFAAQDRAFLLSQGERQYEEQLRPLWDEESYLAMLYRCGDWARERNDTSNRIPRLDPREIREIEFLTWEERGPLVEIRGNLITTGGTRIPCGIVFNPRLNEPKILGMYP